MKKFMKTLHGQSLRKAIACLMAFLIVNGPVWAISELDVINKINADVNTSGNTTTVDITGSRSVIDWSNFNTANGEILEFMRAGGADFAVLNRIIGGATQFDGNMIGNQGHIIVINANGIVFGPTAEVTAHRFTASTLPLTMSDSDFLEGSNNFAFATGSAKGKIELAAGATITAQQIELLAHQIANSGTIVGTGGMVLLATGDDIYLASEIDDIVVVVAAPNLSNFNYSIVNEAAGQIKNETGKVVLAAGDSFAQALSGINNQAYATGDYNVEQKGEILAAELGIGAAQLIALRAGGATEAETIGLAAKKVELDQSLNVAGNLTVDSDFHINATQSLNSGGDMSLVAHQSSVYLQAQTASEGSLTINAGTDIALIQGAASHDTMNLTAGNRLLAHGDLVSQADMTITAAETWSAADVLANDDLTVQSNVFLLGGDDQTLASAEGSVHIDSRIDKLTNGSVYIAAEKDVRLDGNIYVESGGLSAISREGKIHTGDSDALNIRIDAYSNDIWENAGVDLPFKGGQGESLGKAAIVLQSKEDLIIGADAELIARGSYAAAGDMDVNGAGVDDRPGVNFLAEDAVIGGFDRDQGVPIDVAIYAGSTGGDVIVETGDIHVWQYAVAGNDYPFYYGNATVVFDAYDTVSMPFLAEVVAFERKFGGFRLEVASRLCEWLSDAVDGGKLPYAVNPEVIEAILGEGNYVLRGSGQNNGAAADGERAWVLENQPANPIAPPLPVLELPELKGCPAETQAAAAELGISSDNLQMTIRNALAMNPSIQPCDACAGIITSAAILNDADGIRLAAMNQIFNTLAPADAPFTPEVSASVVTAFAQLGDQDRQYALAAEYIDAFVRYVAILDTQLKAPVGDAVAFTLDKYGDTLMSETANPNIAAYILAQLMTEGI